MNKKLNNINVNLKLPPIKNIKNNNYVNPIDPIEVIEITNIKKSPRKDMLIKIKSKKDCANAQEYYSQFTNTKEIYDLRELRIGLKKVSKTLKSNEIYLINTGWDSVWDNSDYSLDCAGEIICKKYSGLVLERFQRYKQFVLSKCKGKFFDIPLAYIDELVSFVIVSDNELHLSKQSGNLTIQTSFINNQEKKLCLKIFKDVFSHRFVYKDNLITIKLHKN